MKHSELITDRFILKILEPEFVGEDYLRWFSNVEASQYIEYAKKAVTLSELNDYVQEKFESDNALFFGIFCKELDRHIGNIKFEPLNLVENYAVMGVLIGDENWRGKGVFVEVDNFLKESLKKIGINKIFLGVSKENTSAVKAYLKAGYEIDRQDFLKVSAKDSYTMVKEL